MTVNEKYEFLRTKIYEKVTHSHTGKLLISTECCRKCAAMLGGDYDKLNKIQKFLFMSDITGEYINPQMPFDKYTRFGN